MRMATGLMVAILVGAAGCGKTSSANDRICRDLNILQGSVTAMANLGPTTTIADVKKTHSAMEDTIRTLKQDAKGLKLTGVTNLETADAALMATIKKIPDKATSAEIKSAITPALTTFDRAQNALSKGLNCPTKAAPQ